jgi:hypothetical protein
VRKQTDVLWSRVPAQSKEARQGGIYGILGLLFMPIFWVVAGFSSLRKRPGKLIGTAYGSFRHKQLFLATGKSSDSVF